MEFRILGPLEVVDGEQPIVLRKGKECALLTYLVLHANEVVPSERLIDVGIDPQTVRVTHSIPLGTSRNSEGTLGLATGEGAVWLTDYDRGTLLRIDPATGVIVSTIRIGEHPSNVAVGAGRIWVSVD